MEVNQSAMMTVAVGDIDNSKICHSLRTSAVPQDDFRFCQVKAYMYDSYSIA